MHKSPHYHPLIKVLSFLTYFPTDALSFGDGLGAEGVSCRAGARVGAGGRSVGSVGAVFFLGEFVAPTGHDFFFTPGRNPHIAISSRRCCAISSGSLSFGLTCACSTSDFTDGVR